MAWLGLVLVGLAYEQQETKKRKRSPLLSCKHVADAYLRIRRALTGQEKQEKRAGGRKRRREKKKKTLNPKPHRPIGVAATTTGRSQATSSA